MPLSQIPLNMMDANAGSFMFRNRIINGDMRIDQRNAGASVTITGGATTLAFGIDRWQIRSAGANASAQQVTVSGLKRLRFTGAASITAVAAHQRIEATNSAELAGSQVTVSLKASSTSLTSLTIELYYANTTDTFGTWGSPTVTSIGSTAVTISTTEQTVSATFSVPSAATTGLELRVTGGALLATQTLTIGDIQLEAGSNATPFERRPYGMELALCQRYFETSYNSGTALGAATTTGLVGGLVSFNATLRSMSVSFAVTKRASPTMAYWDGAGNVNKTSDRNTAAWAHNQGALAAITGSANSFVIDPSATSGYTAFIHYSASAEL